MSIRAYGNNAAIELFEHHLVITRRRPGMIADGPPAEHFLPYSSIRSVQFVRPGFFALGRIVLIGANGSPKQGTPDDPHTVLFPKGQVRQFEDVLHTIRQAIATPSIERIALAAAPNRGRIQQSESPAMASQQEIVVAQPEVQRESAEQSYHHNAKHDDRLFSSQPIEERGAINPTLGGWWRDLPILGKIILIVVPLVFMLSMCSADQPSQGRDGADIVINTDAADTQDLTQESIVGNWIMTPKGGEDGKTDCADFNTPSLYKLNGKTAKILSFGADGKYRSLFAYTTPSSAEHTQVETANWSLEENNIRYDNLSIQTGIGAGASDASLEPVSSPGSNQLIIGSGDAAARYVRCGGSVNDIFPPEITDASVGYEPVPYEPLEADFAALCSDQDVINSTSKIFKNLITQTLLTSSATGNQIGIDEALLGAFIIRERLAKLRLRFLNIRIAKVDDANGQFVKVQCNANVRISEPVEGSNGKWSQYIQFDNSRYSLKIPKNVEGAGEIAILAELPPLNVAGNVETGSE